MKRFKYSNMSDVMFGVVVLLVLVMSYVLLNNCFMKGVETCSKNQSVSYCQQQMSR